MEHNGFFNYFSIALIDKTDGKNPKKKEDYWRRTLKTYSSFGRNIKDSCGVVQFWQSCILMAYNFINNEIFCASTELFSVRECISCEGNSQPLVLVEMNLIMDLVPTTYSFNLYFENCRYLDIVRFSNSFTIYSYIYEYHIWYSPLKVSLKQLNPRPLNSVPALQPTMLSAIRP